MINYFARIKTLLRRLVRLADVAENTVFFSKYVPSRRPGESLELYYRETKPDADLPVPPRNLWLGYGDSEASYVESGRADVESMTAILARAGFDLNTTAQPILDLGCGGGRMIRHLRAATTRTQVWGLDISAPHIGWLKMNLAPPFRFAVNTTVPHLPFPDATFGLIYCGSVFTHIDDLAESWFLETRRVLAPGGILFCTLHDDHTRTRLVAEPGHPLARGMRDHPYLSSDTVLPDVLAIGQGHDSNVFYRDRYLRAMLAGLFEIVTTEPGAYGYQTAWVLRKKSSTP